MCAYTFRARDIKTRWLARPCENSVVVKGDENECAFDSVIHITSARAMTVGCVYNMYIRERRACIRTQAASVLRAGGGGVRGKGGDRGLKVLSKSRVRLGFLAWYPGAINSGFPACSRPGAPAFQIIIFS